MRSRLRLGDVEHAIVRKKWKKGKQGQRRQGGFYKEVWGSKGGGV